MSYKVRVMSVRERAGQNVICALYLVNLKGNIMSCCIDCGCAFFILYKETPPCFLQSTVIMTSK